MRRKLLLLAVVGCIALAGILVAMEVVRREKAALPAGLWESDLRDSAHLLTLLGKPDQHYATSRAGILEKGFDGFEMSPERLPGSPETQLEVMVWRRKEVFWGSKSFRVVVDPATRAVFCYDSSATGWITPVMILSGSEETAPSLLGPCW